MGKGSWRGLSSFARRRRRVGSAARHSCDPQRIGGREPGITASVCENAAPAGKGPLVHADTSGLGREFAMPPDQAMHPACSTQRGGAWTPNAACATWIVGPRRRRRHEALCLAPDTLADGGCATPTTNGRVRQFVVVHDDHPLPLPSSGAAPQTKADGQLKAMNFCDTPHPSSRSCDQASLDPKARAFVRPRRAGGNKHAAALPLRRRRVACARACLMPAPRQGRIGWAARPAAMADRCTPKDRRSCALYLVAWQKICWRRARGRAG